MAVILDTDLLSPRERAGAVANAMELSGIPARVTHEPPPEQIFARIKLWQLGGGTTLMHRDGSGVCLTRSPRQARAVGPERFSLTVLGPGRWTYQQGRHERRVESAAPQVLLTDQTEPYEFNRIGGGETFALGVDHSVLGLPVDRVREAASRIEASPFLGLVRGHILQLSGALDTVPPGPALGMIGNAATELVRALVVSALADPDRQHAVTADSLALRISLFIDEHLTEPDLTPARIARVHHISLRQLYYVWSKSNEQTLGQWLISARLAAARRDLARPDAATQTISTVARRCGFLDTAHFARKFRQEYGMSPSEWRAIARQA
ncbi:MAG: helix-turn-helix domain-containing protein [Nakamurella sp.]